MDWYIACMHVFPLLQFFASCPICIMHLSYLRRSHVSLSMQMITSERMMNNGLKTKWIAREKNKLMTITKLACFFSSFWQRMKKKKNMTGDTAHLFGLHRHQTHNDTQILNKTKNHTDTHRKNTLCAYCTFSWN